MVFFINDTATTEIYTLSLHDALPISRSAANPNPRMAFRDTWHNVLVYFGLAEDRDPYDEEPVEYREPRSEEHTSELQSRQYLVCRLLLEKKKRPTFGCCFYHCLLHHI